MHERLAVTHHPAATHVPATRTHRVPAAPDGARLLGRALVIIGLAAIAVVHLAELPDTWRETPGLGAMFAVLVIAAAINAAALVHHDHSRMFLAAGLVALAPVGGYLLTRSLAVPFDRGDVGNWLEPSVLVALFIEVCVLALCSYILYNARATRTAVMTEQSSRNVEPERVSRASR